MAQHIVIIGNGIAGITCARNVRKQSNDAITIISSETEHFYSRTALMYVYMGHLKYEHIKPYEDWFWEKNKINLVNDYVSHINVQNKNLTLKLGSSIAYDKLIIASGSVSNKPDYPGNKLKGVQSLYGISDVELMNENTKDITRGVIVGGGLIGIEMAEMLLSRNIQVTFLVREPLYWNNILPNKEAELVTRHIKEHHVDIRVETELKEIIGNDEGHVTTIVTNKGEEIKCGFVGITVGVSPNINFLQDSGIEVDRGVLVDQYFQTNIKDVFAIGDCAQYRTPLPGRKPVEQVWYTGRIHGETLALTLAGQQTAYNPGPWFNSAKFFDIEYQTYGTVDANANDDEQSFYWEHSAGKICFRAVYKKASGSIVGFNVLGIRLDHVLCEKWIQEEKHIDEIMSELYKLNFDPEFFDKYEVEILDSYNKQNGKALRSKRKKMFSLFASSRRM